jgi:hypothetical protein
MGATTQTTLATHSVRAVSPVRVQWASRPRPSDDHGHDHKPKRFDAATAPSEIGGGITGQHRHGWLLLLHCPQV